MTVSFAPTEEQELLRKTARRFLTDRAPTKVVRELMTTPDAVDPDLWREIAEMGWLGLAVPEAFGGAGYGLAELGILFEEQGRAVFPGPFLASVVAADVITRLGDDQQRQTLLPPLVAGEQRATLALHEDPHRYDPEAVTTVARRDGSDWVLSGRKRFVLDGAGADVLLVVARTGEAQLAVFAVPREAPGVEVTCTPTLDQTRPQADLELTDVRVPAEARLAGTEAVWPALLAVLRDGATLLANEQVGGAQRCLEMSLEYARTRYQFGRPIGSFQAIKHRLADMLLKVEHARSTAYYAARVTDDPDEFAIAASLAKAVCSDAYLWVAGETIQVHGGIGFTWEHDAHLYFKRARASAMLFGTARLHRRWLADALGL